MKGHRTMDEKSIPDIPPSAFAKMGEPCCSRWGKSEIEWIALAYVQALAADGDTWKKLSREQTYDLLTDEQRREVHGMLTDDFYEHWFQAVSNQITDAQSAFDVGGFWNRYRYEKSLRDSASEGKS
jgi:hypothetical protein